jgi:hypothetical protein
MKTGHLITTNNGKDGNTALARVQSAALENLLPEHRKIIEAGLRPTLVKLEVMDVLEQLTDTVNMAYGICGQKPDEATVMITVNELYTKLRETYPHCTMEEVRTAIRNGVYDEYGEYFGLNVRSFIMFIREYLFSEQRRAARAAFAAARSKEEKPKTQEPPYWEDSYWTPERTAQWTEVTDNCYRWFCEDSILSGFIQEGSYWLLKRCGAISMPDGYITELVERAKQAKRIELVKNEARKHPNEIKQTLEQLQNIDEYPDLRRLIHFSAKRLAVLDYFTALQKKERSAVHDDPNVNDADKH